MAQRLFFACALALSLTGCTAIVDNNLKSVECLADDQCPSSDNLCVARRQCNTMTHACEDKPNSIQSCDDGEACTADSCDVATAGCMNTLIDADHDGYAPETCTTPAYMDKGDDCNDNNSAVNPGVQEVCGNGIDDNCNGLIDNADPTLPSSITCYRDADGDGFHDPSISMMGTCSCPSGYIQANATPDCADGVAAANPAASDWFGVFYCKQGNEAQDAISTSGGYVCPSGWTPSWDYNCTGAAEQEYTVAPNTSCSFVSPFLAEKLSTLISPTIIALRYCANTWDSASTSGLPSCGTYANQWTCASSTSCNSYVSSVQQKCH